MHVIVIIRLFYDLNNDCSISPTNTKCKSVVFIFREIKDFSQVGGHLLKKCSFKRLLAWKYSLAKEGKRNLKDLREEPMLAQKGAAPVALVACYFKKFSLIF